MIFSFKENKLRVQTHPNRQYLFVFHTENTGSKTNQTAAKEAIQNQLIFLA